MLLECKIQKDDLRPGEGYSSELARLPQGARPLGIRAGSERDRERGEGKQ